MMKTNGVTVNGRHSFNDYHLVLTAVDLGFPDPKTCFVDVPGRKVPLDGTESLYGGTVYGNRTIKLTFAGFNSMETFHTTYSTIANLFLGKKIELSFDTDPGYYYKGRLTKMTPGKRIKNIDTLVLEFTCEPYKYFDEPGHDWEWDTFSFVDGVIRDFKDVSVAGTKSIEIDPASMVFRPTVRATSRMNLTIGDQTWTIYPGIDTVLDTVTIDQKTTLTFTGSGSVTITLKGESL